MLGYFGKVFVRKQHQSLAENWTSAYKGLFKNLYLPETLISVTRVDAFYLICHKKLESGWYSKQ